MSILKLYLTSLEPDINQTTYSQSIGGYVSNSTLYPETTVSSTVGLYDESISLFTPPEGHWAEWQGVEYISIGNELIQVSPIVDGALSVVKRGVNNIINMHKQGDVATASSLKGLFNDVFNEDRKQYRCIAIKNIFDDLNDPSIASTAYEVSVYFKQGSRNPDTNVKMALERPSSIYITGTATSWTTMQIIDTSLIGIYEDNYFKDAYLKITGGEALGQGKVISSFDSETGTLTFYNSFSSAYDYTVNPDYEILPASSQRVKTGTVSPVLSEDNEDTTSFTSASENLPLRFYDSGSIVTIAKLEPNEVFYIWLERKVSKGTEEYLNNDLVINIRYKENG